ncbi:MAG: ester cyclase [Nitrososphaerales archaeon]
MQDHHHVYQFTNTTSGLKDMDAEGVVRKAIEAFNQHNLDELMPLYANDVLHLHPFPQPTIGIDALRKENSEFFEAFPDLEFEVSNLISKGEWASAEFILKGTNKGPMISRDGTSTPATNKRVERQSSVFWRLNSDGLIAEEHFYFDTAGLFGT